MQVVCAALLWDRLMTPQRAALPFYAEFSEVAIPAAFTSAMALSTSSQPESVSLAPPNGAAALRKPHCSCTAHCTAGPPRI